MSSIYDQSPISRSGSPSGVAESVANAVFTPSIESIVRRQSKKSVELQTVIKGLSHKIKELQEIIEGLKEVNVYYYNLAIQKSNKEKTLNKKVQRLMQQIRTLEIENTKLRNSHLTKSQL